MKDTAPIGLGILAVAAVFGLIGGGVALVLWEFSFVASLFIAGCVAGIVMLLLWLGWRDPAPTLQETQAAKAAEMENLAAAPTAAATPVAAPAPKAAPAPAPKAEEPAPAPKAAQAAKAEPAPAATAADLPPVSADGKPPTLDKARDGGADNLKEIKGVGPKLEQLLNKMGFFHFDQIAVWREKEIAWVDENLEGFKGRVTRDDWVAQAKILAEGGETEFSKKVDKGGVY